VTVYSTHTEAEKSVVAAAAAGSATYAAICLLLRSVAGARVSSPHPHGKLDMLRVLLLFIFCCFLSFFLLYLFFQKLF